MTKFLLGSLVLGTIILAGCQYQSEPANPSTISDEEQEFLDSGRAKAVEDIDHYTDDVLYGNWETIDSHLGFSFRYPPAFLLADADMQWSDSKSYVEIEIIDIGQQDAPTDLSREDAMETIEALHAGEFGFEDGFLLPESKQVQSVGFLFAQDYMVLARFEVCDVTLERIIRFYFNSKQITLTFHGPVAVLQETMPEYFKLDAENCFDDQLWNFDQWGKFYKTLVDGQAASEIQQWYDDVDAVVESVVFENR